MEIIKGSTAHEPRDFAERAAVFAYLREMVGLNRSEGGIRDVSTYTDECGNTAVVTNVEKGGRLNALRPIFEAHLKAYSRAMELGGDISIRWVTIDNGHDSMPSDMEELVPNEVYKL